VTCLSAAAQTQSETGGQAQGQQGKATSVKAKLQKIGVGERSAVRFKLKAGTQLRGYVSQIGNDSFTITEKASKTATYVSYGDVQSLKEKGLSTTAKVLIVVGIGVVIFVAVAAYEFSSHGVGMKI
jgi:hypothetical protein